MTFAEPVRHKFDSQPHGKNNAGADDLSGEFYDGFHAFDIVNGAQQIDERAADHNRRYVRPPLREYRKSDHDSRI